MIQFLKQLFCGHTWSPNLVTHHHMAGNSRVKRHYFYCLKCGKRKYVD